MIEHILLFTSLMLPSVPAGEPVACIRTTISASGRTSRSEIVVRSGDRQHDRGALEFLGAMDFSRLPLGLELGQTGYILVRKAGPQGYTADVTGPRLLASCPAQASPAA